MATLGDTIRTLRKRKGWTQEELGEKVGLRKSAVAKYENGRIENITTAMTEKFAQALGVSVHELLEPFESNLYALDVEIHDTATGVRLTIPGTNALAEYSTSTWDGIVAARDYNTVWEDLGLKKEELNARACIEGLSGNRKWLVDYAMSLTEDEAKQFRGIVEFIHAQKW